MATTTIGPPALAASDPLARGAAEQDLRPGVVDRYVATYEHDQERGMRRVVLTGEWTVDPAVVRQ